MTPSPKGRASSGGSSPSSKGVGGSPPAAHAPPLPAPVPVENADAPAPLAIDHAAYGHVDGGGDADSTYESDTDSRYTSSVTSSIYHYQYENGRRYHAYREGQYVLPNDDQEQERLNLQHHIWRLLIGGRLYTAPLTLPKNGDDDADSFRILDLGCGTGVWAIEMADEIPAADVFGVDLSPIQPEWTPPNCRFHVDDFEQEWTYTPSERFDFIHGRALSGASGDWPRFYAQVMENLKPGGWVEMQEYDAWVFSDDDSFERAVWTKEWCEKLAGASVVFGRPINCAKDHRQWMIDAGFQDVKEEVYRIPIGPWAMDPTLKELGRFELAHMQMSVDSHTPALFTRVWNYSMDQARILAEGVKREFRSRDYRLITSYRFISGRKPEEAV
ncbi:S-adenosyl-L-methionine-dependent methyltransferase [Plectosphaerella plurivora]|uniref:S-adenosyl-L-methionine-dependent methyltransferase n=1 Tax=Plectosphaerella plurivora TaxID=936078 RepID=A0A9P8VJ96_9PEZI|nr:S-adenosyl-L-methionine-dependent methyltransferase [Plectosphaerella plurivora]